MPVVRELKNRVSFDVAPGTVANAEKSFSKIKGSGLSAIGAIKGGFKGILTAIGAVAASGTGLFVEFEKNIATAKFFSKSDEEARKLLDTVNKLRGSEVISRRERAQASAELSKLSTNVRNQLEGVLPILEDISIAQPSLDFPATIKVFAEFVKSGDIEGLEQLGAVGKDLGEQLKLANLNVEQTIKGQQNRFQHLYGLLGKNRDRIKELREEQEQTLTFSFRTLSKEASDFTLQFGEKTAPELRKLIVEVKDTIKALNESESFWNTVKSTLSITADILKGLGKGTEAIGALFSGDWEKLRKMREEATGEQPEQISPGQLIEIGGEKAIEGLSTAGSAIQNEVKRGIDEFAEESRKLYIDPAKEKISQGKSLIEQTINRVKKEVTETKISIDGQIKLVGENISNLNMEAVEAKLNQTLEDKIIRPLTNSYKNLAAANGAPVTTD